nr:hypothetical protein [Staphylococcus saprophyticus]
MDLFSINKAMRRQMEEQEIKGVDNIKSEVDVVTLEVLAIYQ